MSDLIKRADAIRAIHREARIAGGSVAIEYADMFQDVIEALPSADRPQGEWINTAPSYRSDNIICDQCGYNSIARYDYCPNCGARMKGASK